MPPAPLHPLLVAYQVGGVGGSMKMFDVVGASSAPASITGGLPGCQPQPIRPGDTEEDTL